jgi:hypothetical protein
MIAMIAMIGAAAATHGLRRLAPLAVCFLYRALAGIALALPVSFAVAGVVGDHPRGDAVLFDPTATWLVETLRIGGPSLRAYAPYAMLLLSALVFGWLLPLAALIASLGKRDGEASMGKLLGVAAERFGPLALLLGVTLLLQAALVALAAFIGGAVVKGAESTVTADKLRLLAPALALTFMWLVGVIQDVIRVPMVQRHIKLPAAIVAAWAILAGGVWRTLANAAWRTALAVASLLGAGYATIALVGPRDGPMTVALLQYLAVAVMVLMRASWLAWLSQRLEATEQSAEPDDEAELAPEEPAIVEETPAEA